jgi:hypothetical protein
VILCYLWTATLAHSYQPPDHLANGVYHWRVLPVDAAGHLGTPSNLQCFLAAYATQSVPGRVPTLISPEDESIPIFTPTIHWTVIEGAQYYHLEYTSDGSGDFSAGTSLDTRQTFYTPTNTLSNSLYFCWLVRVEVGQAGGDWSGSWHFTKNWDLQPQ